MTAVLRDLVGRVGNYPVSGNAIAREFGSVPLSARPGLLWMLEAERSLNLYAQPQRFAYGHVYDVADILDRTSIGARLLKQQRGNG